jgi:predicted P-loop ATPase
MMIRESGAPAHELNDAAQEELWLRIDREHRFRPSYAFFEKMVKSLTRERPLHPVRDYLNALKWDGKPRINSWLMDRPAGGRD